MRRVQALALGLALVASLARAESGPQFRDLENQALGGSGVASSRGATALFINPAGLYSEEGGEFGIATDLGVNSVLVDYAKWASDNYQYLKQIDSLLARMQPVDYKWAPFSQSFLLHGRYQGIAFAVVEDIHYELTLGKAVVTPVPGVGMLSDLVFTGGKGFEGPEGYRFGVALKYLYRLRYDSRLMGTTEEAWYQVTQAWKRPGNGIMDQWRKLGIAGDIAKPSHGVGVNLGVEKDVADNWTAGVAFLDFPTLIGSKFARPEINLGMGYHRDLKLVEDLDTRGLVNIDFHRFLIPGTPWFKQIKAGTALEGYLNKRPVGHVALGLNDGYPTFGLRVGYIGYFSYVYVAEEIGTYPGQEKLSFHKLSFEIEL